MLPGELNKIISEVIARKSESQYIELKAAKKGTPERLYDTLSSFANQCGGGTVIFGIDEKNDYEVCGVYDAGDLQTKVTQQALQMEPVIRPVFTVTVYDEKYVVSAEISECDTADKPCFYRGAGRLRGSYVRVGESDEPMTEYEIYSYEVYKKKIRDELRPVERASRSDFSQDLLNEYYFKIRKAKPNLAKHDKDKILTLQGMSANGKPTVAGLMILGDYPQAYAPQLSVTAMAVDGVTFGETGASGERFIDNKRIDGTISEMLESALAFVRRNMKVATVINADGAREDRPEYPVKAVREIILNALIHRDYSIHTEDSPIRIVMYKDRIEVENPGGLYGRLTVNDLGKMPADTRNPFIASNLEIMIDTENRFSGIPTVYREMKDAGLLPPVFESRHGNFKAILYNEQVGASNRGNPAAFGSATEKRIYLFCKEPKTKDEIAKMLGIETAYYVVTHYLRPMTEAGILKMTIPEKPKSKFQRYYSVGYFKPSSPRA